ncbi:methyl-accepting chemotaxis protein [Desulfobacter latus]|uniref:Cache and HAMP domain-containing protein n=1 Tax=Desulfobacter latus TaxID=2292 RepID=A0A850TDI7_9BACT|nr:methyl-accepting chemotaxis protein [Desulfobacter latus]NWH06347.1 cache and HAMP domain-containing protein [Desulfobacter latus]
MLSFFGRSIKGFFFYALIFLVLFPGLCIGFFSLRAIESNIKEDVKLNNLFVARSLAAQINEVLSRADKIIQVIGHMVQEESAADRDMDAVLARVVDAFPAFSSIQILDRQGIVRYCSRGPYCSVGYDLSRHPGYINALEQDGPCWSGTHIHIRESVPSITVSRLFNKYVIVGYLDLTELSRHVGTLTAEVGIEAVVLDRHANVAACSEPGKAEHRVNLSNLNFVRQGLDGTFTSGLGLDDQGNRSIISMTEVKVADLLTVTFRDAELAMAPVTYARKIFMISMILACLISIGVIIFIYHRIKIPLKAFSDYTDRVAGGDYDLSAEISRLSEFRHLEQNFLFMAGAVSAREDDLKKALADVRKLSGLLPICARCKKIRDDKGYWNTLEAYIEEHSEASFSHGLCEKCSDELYGKQDWYIQMKKK